MLSLSALHTGSAETHLHDLQNRENVQGTSASLAPEPCRDGCPSASHWHGSCLIVLQARQQRAARDLCFVGFKQFVLCIPACWLRSRANRSVRR